MLWLNVIGEFISTGCDFESKLICWGEQKFRFPCYLSACEIGDKLPEDEKHEESEENSHPAGFTCFQLIVLPLFCLGLLAGLAFLLIGKGIIRPFGVIGFGRRFKIFTVVLFVLVLPLWFRRVFFFKITALAAEFVAIGFCLSVFVFRLGEDVFLFIIFIHILIKICSFL